MNGHTTLPIKSWKAEAAKLAADKYVLFDEYYRLKDDVENVELLRRGTENIMREDVSRTQLPQAHGIDL